MTISSGTRLGPYEIVAPLGAGGMGEVWHAKDTRLGRDVAIKVLPPIFAADVQLLQRFEREAKAISQLSHPHVCTLFDVGKGESAGNDDLHYLVMEYLEGESLADRIRKGPLPPHDVLKYGQQIALALDAAHREGITHRDLKPGNVMLTKSGAKLLDFGLAKTAAEGKSPIDGLTNLPTEAKPLTTEGTILGTFQYMAPEQLEGLEADARTDIFALGALLYEMATGRRAFEGSSKTSLIAAIVSSQPEPISSVVAVTPPALDHVVRKCLEKNPEDRWQSAHDIAGELQWISETGSVSGVAVSVSNKKRRLAWMGWIAAFLIASTWLGTVFTRTTPVRPRVETAIVAPVGVFVNASPGGIVLSPDGSVLAFIGHREGESRRIWIRELASSSVRELAGTEDVTSLFSSPDGKSIAFVAEDKLRRIAVDGGSAETIASGLNADSGGTWTRGGDILYSTDNSIFRVAASGGTTQKVVELPNRTLTNPRILPDDRRFLFTSIRGSTEPDALYVGSLDGGEPTPILTGVYSNTAYVSSGLILYLREGDLRAQPVDPKTLALRGDPIRLAAGVQYDPSTKNALFSISENGSLAYVVGEGAGKTELAWVSRDGSDIQVVAPAAMYYTPRLSHDEKRIAVDLSEAQTASGDVWIFDLQRKTSTRLTYDPANESSPIWTPDDRTVIFFSEKNGHLDLFERSAGGIGNDEALLEDSRAKIPQDLTPDGRSLAFTVTEGPGQNTDIWLLDRETGKAEPFLTSPFDEAALEFSPDGKWVVFASDESGQSEVYVLQYPESTGKWIVSRGGGQQPAWSADGRHIYYISNDQKLMSVEIDPGDVFDSGPPVALFDMQVRMGFTDRQYCVARDDSRFLVNRRVGESEARPITLVQNWTTGSGR